jgi:copper chaperone CopZ
MTSMKKTVLTSVSFAALLTALGCGDSGAKTEPNPPIATGVDALKDAAKKAGVPTPVTTANGTSVLAFDFNEEDPCAHCVGELTEALGKLPGIKKCDAEKGKRTFTVEFDAKALDAAKLVEAIAKAGDGAKPKLD